MASDGRAYADVLAEAQAAGYAEADPSGDVEGDDAVNKLVILARLAFGAWLDPAIDRPSPADRRGRRPARHHRGRGRGARGGRRRRAHAQARSRSPAGPTTGRSRRSVLPTAIPSDSPLGRTGGVQNRIEIDAEPLGRVDLRRAGRRRSGDEQRDPGRPRGRRPPRGRTWAGLPPAAGTVVAGAGCYGRFAAARSSPRRCRSGLVPRPAGRRDRRGRRLHRPGPAARGAAGATWPRPASSRRSTRSTD